jgi:hypothetical protein
LDACHMTFVAELGTDDLLFAIWNWSFQVLIVGKDHSLIICPKHVVLIVINIFHVGEYGMIGAMEVLGESGCSRSFIRKLVEVLAREMNRGRRYCRFLPGDVKS